MNPQSIENFVEGHFGATIALLGVLLVLLCFFSIWTVLAHQQRQRLQFEMLLANLSAEFTQVEPGEIGAKTSHWLKVIAEAFGVDRTAFGELMGDGSGLRVLHAYAGEHIPAVPGQITSKDLPWVFSQLYAGEIVNLRKTQADLPPEAEDDRSFFRRQGVKSLLAVPMEKRGMGSYMVSFACVRRYARWDGSPHVRLRLVCEVFASALALSEARQSELLLARKVEQEQRRTREILAGLHGVIWETRGDPASTQSVIEYIKGNLEELLGTPDVEAIHNRDFWRRLLHPDDRARAEAENSAIFARGRDGIQQFRWVTPAGKTLWMESHVQVVCDETGRPMGLRGFTFDVTARKNAEDELHKSHEQVRQLAGRLISAQEDERRRIAQELHDDLSQRLAAQAIQLTNVKRDAESGNSVSVLESIEKLRQAAVQIADDVRALSHELHPPVLVFAGLAGCLEALCQEFTTHKGLRVSFRVESDPGRASAGVALCLYRTAQEALQNVWKHASATSVNVTLTKQNGSILLRIEDDGVGISATGITDRRGLGLISLGERAHLLRGSFSVTPRSAGGTCLEVGIPGD